jgi:hypothetical protein
LKVTGSSSSRNSHAYLAVHLAQQQQQQQQQHQAENPRDCQVLLWQQQQQPQITQLETVHKTVSAILTSNGCLAEAALGCLLLLLLLLLAAAAACQWATTAAAGRLVCQWRAGWQGLVGRQHGIAGAAAGAAGGVANHQLQKGEQGMLWLPGLGLLAGN